MKAILAFTSVAIVLIVIFFTNKPNTKPQEKLNPGTANNRETDGQVYQTPASESSRYIPYSNGVLEKNTDKRRVLFFFANWCPTCRPADASFSQNSDKIPMDVTLIRVNYNDSETDEEEKALAGKYGVTYQHTFVQIDNSGKKIKIWNGGQIDELLSNLR